VLAPVEWSEVSCGQYCPLDSRGRTITCGWFWAVASFYNYQFQTNIM